MVSKNGSQNKKEGGIMKFEFADPKRQPCRIKVVGVGGGGGNAVNRMVEEGIQGVEFTAINTDLQVLQNSKAPEKVQIGVKLTKGLGSGGRPDIGRKAIEENSLEVKENIEGANIVFIACGMGGGTGTGASPIIAQMAKELGALTVGIVTKPFDFEGTRRKEQAEQGIIELKEKTDSVIVIPNQRLLAVASKQTSFLDAFRLADSILLQATKGISEIITRPGFINVDFADVQAVMSEPGIALMGIGRARGEDRAVEAAEEAISSPLLEDISIDGAKAVLVNITTGKELSLHELNEAMNTIRNKVAQDANIIMGAVMDEDDNDEVSITIIATGMEKERKRKLLRETEKIYGREETERLPAFKRRRAETLIDLETPTFMRKQMD